jgi:hypothetical protein
MRSSVRELAKALYDGEGLVDLYSLHDRFLLGPAELLRALRVLERIGIVAEECDGVVKLSVDGRKRIWALRRSLLSARDRPWATMELDRLDPAAPYLPDLAKVERSFFYAKLARGEG